jgi:hypothetical protein
MLYISSYSESIYTYLLVIRNIEEYPKRTIIGKYYYILLR